MKNIFKYIILPSLLLIIFIVSFVKFNIEAFNYELSWGGNKGKWIYSDSGYIYPNHSINFKAGDSLRYNGVTVTSGTGGGGISGSDNITFSGVNTFTHKNTFSDTLKADGLSLIDNARITSDLNVTGDVISDLNFLKGSSTSIGTISTDSLAFITNNTKRIVINKNGYTNFTDTVQMSDYVQIIGNLNVGTNITALGKVTADSLLGIGYYITDINAANIASGKIDSARIPNTAKIDTANFAHTNSGITEIFNSIVSFATTVTFTVSPVFSALVNFANGINVTGNATVSGDLVLSGWIKNQSSNSELSYWKTKILKFKAPAVGGTVTVAHGITDWHSIVRYTALIKDDTTNYTYQSGEYYATAGGVIYCRCDTSLFRLELSGTAYGLANDSGYVVIDYVDPNR
jgi:hypothetical protein